MKVHLKGLNGCLDRIVDDIEAILFDGDKIHFTYADSKDSIVVGFTAHRANYCLKSIWEGNNETAIR